MRRMLPLEPPPTASVIAVLDRFKWWRRDDERQELLQEKSGVGATQAVVFITRSVRMIAAFVGASNEPGMDPNGRAVTGIFWYRSTCSRGNELWLEPVLADRQQDGLAGSHCWGMYTE